MNCGIYSITHIASGKRYIGQSVRISARLAAHRGYLRRRAHENPKLSRAIAKHGLDAFRFETLIIAAPEMLTFYEQLLIDGLDTVRKGYNISPIAESTRGTHRTEEQRRRMAAVQQVSMNRPEVKATVSAATKRAMSRPEVRARHLAGMQSVEGRANLLAAVKRPQYVEKQLATRASEAFRAKLTASLQAGWDKRPERRQKQSMTIAALHADPVYKAKFLASMGTPERRALIAKQAAERWADPEYKARVGGKIRETYARKKFEREADELP
jgi:group I intron endonuclease